MNLKEQIEEILKPLINADAEEGECIMCGFPFDKKIRKKEVEQVTTDILKAVELDEEKIKQRIIKWVKEQEAIDKFGEITLRPEYNDLDELAKAIAQGDVWKEERR